MMGCLGEESHIGKGRGQGEGKKEYGKTEGREQEADHRQAGCWTVCLSGQALCLITTVCSTFLSYPVPIYYVDLFFILHMY